MENKNKAVNNSSTQEKDGNRNIFTGLLLACLIFSFLGYGVGYYQGSHNARERLNQQVPNDRPDYRRNPPPNWNDRNQGRNNRPGADFNSRFAERLNLNAEQREEFDAIQTKAMEEGRKIFQSSRAGDITREQMQEKMAEIWKNTLSELKEVLNEEQYTRYEEMASRFQLGNRGNRNDRNNQNRPNRQDRRDRQNRQNQPAPRKAPPQ
jgi:hypothetical protein